MEYWNLVFKVYLVGVLINNIIHLPFYYILGTYRDYKRIFILVLSTICSWFIMPQIIEEALKIMRIYLKAYILVLMREINEESKAINK